MENSTCEHQWYYIFVSWKNGKQPSEIHKELEVAEGPKALSLCTIYQWIEAFEEGENSIEDASQSGHPHEAVTQNCCSKKSNHNREVLCQSCSPKSIWKFQANYK